MNKNLAHRALALMLMTAVLTGGSSFVFMEKLHAAPVMDARVNAQPSQPVDVNKAGLEELQTVRGIGPVLAERIVQHREQNGRFEKIEDLAAVPGIGQAKLEKLRSQVTI